MIEVTLCTGREERVLPKGYNHIVLNYSTQSIYRGHSKFLLAFKQFLVAAQLLTNEILRPGIITSKEDFYDALHGTSFDGGPDDFDAIIDVYMTWLRPKFKALGVRVETLHRQGYITHISQTWSDR